MEKSMWYDQPVISDDVLRQVIEAVIGEMDYDHVKQLDPETAEEPDTVEERWERLLAVARAALEESK